MACAKIRYGDRNRAVRARERMDRKKGVMLRVYRCAACKGWHLGNDRETRLENINRIFDRLPASDRAQTLKLIGERS